MKTRPFATRGAVPALAAGLLVLGCIPVVSYVDLSRYVGKWYEIASYPAFFQDQCYGGTTATYAPVEGQPDRISVRNECRVGSLDGALDVANATARITDTKTNAKLKVNFGGIFSGDYWIIDLDPAPGDQPYRWAVVSEPTKNFLWILSREPTLDDETLDGILDRLEALEFDLSKLRFTPQAAP